MLRCIRGGGIYATTSHLSPASESTSHDKVLPAESIRSFLSWEKSLRIDAHHHLWRYSATEFGWIGEELGTLRRDFLPVDLHPVLAAAHVDGTIAVQARQSIEETRFLLELAHSEPAILGVVGWLPLASPQFEGLLHQFATEPLLKGLRHVVQAEPDGFLDGDLFNRGIAHLQRAGLVYDILIVERQLPEAIRFVDRHPGQSFVLDHIAKPRIAAGHLEPWRTHLRALAERPNVACKLSGMVTEADPQHWTEQQLQPFFECALEAFGPARSMIGSDWPVLTAACTYPRWWTMIEGWISALSQSERDAILGGTAQRIYGLNVAPGRSTPAHGKVDR